MGRREILGSRPLSPLCSRQCGPRWLRPGARPRDEVRRAAIARAPPPAAAALGRAAPRCRAEWDRRAGRRGAGSVAQSRARVECPGQAPPPAFLAASAAAFLSAAALSHMAILASVACRRHRRRRRRHVPNGHNRTVSCQSSAGVLELGGWDCGTGDSTDSRMEALGAHGSHDRLCILEWKNFRAF